MTEYVSAPPARVVFGGRTPSAPTAGRREEIRSEYYLARLSARAALKQGYKYDFDLLNTGLREGITVSVHIVGRDLRELYDRLPALCRATAVDNLLAFIEAEQTGIGTTYGISGTLRGIAARAKDHIMIGLELMADQGERSGEALTYKLRVATQHKHTGGGQFGDIRLGGHGFMVSPFLVGVIPAAHIHAILSAT